MKIFEHNAEISFLFWFKSVEFCIFFFQWPNDGIEFLAWCRLNLNLIYIQNFYDKFVNSDVIEKLY